MKIDFTENELIVLYESLDTECERVMRVVGYREATCFVLRDKVTRAIEESNDQPK